EGNGRQFVLNYVTFENKVWTGIAKDIFVVGRAHTVHWGNPADNSTPLQLFDYTMDRNQLVEWTDEQINEESSPIFGRHAGKIKESLRNCTSGSIGAKTLESWAATLKRFHPFAFDRVVAPIPKSQD
ncbi:unnamed protein product, partial [Prorocentrum cordatum]